MARFEPELPLAVALSGGADSTALLLACAEKWPGQVSAIHVHHGLQVAADSFEQHCIRLCAQLEVPLQVERVDAHASPGQSPEDAARRARYEAFEAIAQANRAQAAIQSIAIAQHADDQVETILLALSRGAGLPGLAAMPAHWQRGGIGYHRPFLEVPAIVLRDWLRLRDTAWIEDPTNTDERFTRNRLRARLLPALEATFPAFRATFARTARHAAQASELLRALAQADLLESGSPPRLAVLQKLSVARQSNLLRHWLLSAHRVTPSAAQLDELQGQVAACTTRGHRIHLKVATGHVVRAEDALRYEAAPKTPSDA
jgi:tRNA(Ile)-lysidine synthase